MQSNLVDVNTQGELFLFVFYPNLNTLHCTTGRGNRKQLVLKVIRIKRVCVNEN